MGDPACHLSSVCLSCGRFVEETDASSCPHCGESIVGGRASEVAPIFAVNQVNTILYCADFGATVAFYRGLLRLEVTFSNDWFVEFHLGDHTMLSIADASRTSIPPVEGKGLTLSLKVSDLDALRDRLIGLGIEATPISTRFGSRVFDIHDPEGHRIEFWVEGNR